MRNCVRRVHFENYSLDKYSLEVMFWVLSFYDWIIWIWIWQHMEALSTRWKILQIAQYNCFPPRLCKRFLHSSRECLCAANVPRCAPLSCLSSWKLQNVISLFSEALLKMATMYFFENPTLPKRGHQNQKTIAFIGHNFALLSIWRFLLQV